MQILGYGEDALTVWALTNKISDILTRLDDMSPIDACMALFRPSFGRRGGPLSSQFGEFDCILATPQGVHLCETKWQSSPEVRKSVINLRPEQIARHKIFTLYYTTWVSKSEWLWDEFKASCGEGFKRIGIDKPIPPNGSLLEMNLKTTLTKISSVTCRSKLVDNVLLLLDGNGALNSKQLAAPEGFLLVIIDVSKDIKDGFISLGK